MLSSSKLPRSLRHLSFATAADVGRRQGPRMLQSFVLQSKVFALLLVPTASACSSYRSSSALLDIADSSATTVVLQSQTQIPLENGLVFLPAALRQTSVYFQIDISMSSTSRTGTELPMGCPSLPESKFVVLEVHPMAPNSALDRTTSRRRSAALRSTDAADQRGR
jgi:hypothetical protein